MKKKTIFIVCASVMLLAGGISAVHQKLFAKGHGGNEAGMHHAMFMHLFMAAHENPGMRAELMEYCSKNVFPIVREERAKLEEKLTDGEKKTIADVRNAIKAKQPQITAMMQQMHGKMDAGEQETGAMADMHKELMQTVAPLNGISEKYQTEMTAIGNRLQANAGEWHENLMKIGDKWMPKKDEQKEHGHMHDMFKHHFKAMHENGHTGDMHQMMAIHFLLLDPNATSLEDFFPFRFHEMSDSKANEQPVALKVYPNPSNSGSTIEYEVKNAGNVTIDIIDKDGKTVAKLLNEYRKEGKYSLPVDLQKYHEGTYYIRYSDARNTSSKILLKQ